MDDTRGANAQPTDFGPAGSAGGSRSLASLISPDDWRLYHLMRELSNDNRARVLAYAEMLRDLESARDWAGQTASADGDHG